jgi:hypothetical protein
MVAEDGPRPPGGRFGVEVNLYDLASRVAAHHDVEEH